LSEYSALFEKGTDWKSVQLPQSTLGGSHSAIASATTRDAQRTSGASGSLPVRFRPIVVMPGVGRLDFSHALGTVTGGAVEGTTGLFSSTTGAVGNTIRGVGQRAGAAAGGVNEDLGGAVGAVSQGVGNTVEGVGTTADNVGQGVGDTLEIPFQSLDGKEQ